MVQIKLRDRLKVKIVYDRTTLSLHSFQEWMVGCEVTDGPHAARS